MILLTVKNAIHELIQACPAPKTTQVPLRQSLQHILAQPVYTTLPIPHFTKAPYDGFAFFCEEPNAKGLQFQVVGRIGAGEIYPHMLKTGEALRIMTGAPFPEGADTLAMFEQCTEEITATGTQITVKGSLLKGANRIMVGEECAQNTQVLTAGQRITPGVIAVLAGMGMTEVSVFAPPKIAIITSGKEVVNPDIPLTPCTVYNSNSPMLEALLAEMGCTPYFVQHITDTPADLNAQIEELRPHLQEADIVISTGGVSVGDFDTLPQIYSALGATPLFTKIAMRPGAAQYAGVRTRPSTTEENASISSCASTPQTLFIGLSGNPSAAYNGFQLLAKPAIETMQGLPYAEPLQIVCTLHQDLIKRNPVDRYIQGNLRQSGNTLYFEPVELFTSNALIGLGQTRALYCMPRGTTDMLAGSSITVQLL